MDDPIDTAEILYEKPLDGAYPELLFGSDLGNTLWVKFSDKDGCGAWVGKFECGDNTIMWASQMTPPDKFLIVAGGLGYLMDASKRELLETNKFPHATSFTNDPDKNLLIYGDHTRVHVWSAGKPWWSSPEVASGWIHNLRIKDGKIYGAGEFDYSLFPFSIDLESREVTWLSGPPTPSRTTPVPAGRDCSAVLRRWWSALRARSRPPSRPEA